MREIRWTRAVAAAALASTVALAAACGGSGDKAGGSGTGEPHVLRLANPNDEPPEQLVAWADEVRERSEGALEIEFANDWRRDEPDYEAGTIQDVQTGEADVAWVGARAFDTIGVTDFQALVAPLLIDSHDLQQAVFEEGVPTEMLDGLDEIDLVGLGVLAGPMRKPLGVREPLVTPDDYRGATIGIQASAVAERTLTALGATPRAVPSGASLDGLDGYEQQLASIAGNHYETEAGYVTANVNLWPRPLVLVANPAMLESLTTEEQAALRDASEATIPNALDASRAEDQDGAAAVCRQGMTLASASDGELAQLRAALEPVYDELTADSTTRSFIETIMRLKRQLSAPPDAPACDATDAETPDAAFPEGTYEMTLTRQDARQNGCVAEEEARHDESRFTLTLEDGSVEMTVEYGGRGGRPEHGWSGTYAVFRDRVELTDNAGTMTAHWTFDGTNLTFSDLEDAPGCGDDIIWTTHPWTLTQPD